MREVKIIAPSFRAINEIYTMRSLYLSNKQVSYEEKYQLVH